MITEVPDNVAQAMNRIMHGDYANDLTVEEREQAMLLDAELVAGLLYQIKGEGARIDPS